MMIKSNRFNKVAAKSGAITGLKLASLTPVYILIVWIVAPHTTGNLLGDPLKLTICAYLGMAFGGACIGGWAHVSRYSNLAAFLSGTVGFAPGSFMLVYIIGKVGQPRGIPLVPMFILTVLGMMQGGATVLAYWLRRPEERNVTSAPAGKDCNN